jgi:hypothetical protein
METLMESDTPHQAGLTVAASFLPHFFLENLAIRHDNSILVTVVPRANQGETAATIRMRMRRS